MTRCPQCGTSSLGVGTAGLCPSCLLGLALGADEVPEVDEDAILPSPVYRVLTILASEAGRTNYLAEQDHTRRLVTLDIVRISQESAETGPSGRRERLRALMGWVNPGVPSVIDGRRTPSGDFCLVAHYVHGPRLDRLCETRRLDRQNRARLFAELCEIVSDGHRHGVCHGRLRPDLVIAAGGGEEGSLERVQPMVLGYSIVPDRTPATGDDVAGLESVARAMGWHGRTGRVCDSVDALLAAASDGWPVTLVAGPSEQDRG